MHGNVREGIAIQVYITLHLHDDIDHRIADTENRSHFMNLRFELLASNCF